jgi:2-isopropylmalate synthase
VEHQSPSDHGDQPITATLLVNGKSKTIQGHGNGPVDGFVDAICKESGIAFDVADYREHAMGKGANAAAIAYVELRLADGTSLFGVGIDKNIVVASLKAVVSGVNRARKR